MTSCAFDYLSSERTSIESFAVLHIRNGRFVSYGAHQAWYPTYIKRLSGCGATSASNLLWYLSATRPKSCRALYTEDARTRKGMLRLMERVWPYIRPGLRGVDKASIFFEGAIRYGAAHGVALGYRVLEIPAETQGRPAAETVREFLLSAFADNLPVAFLNLSNGAVHNLDNWHWVTLVSVDRELRAEMYDQESRQLIDLRLWLATTKGGGAFVVLEPETDDR